VLQSSDGVRFNVHRKKMERHSDAFADASSISNAVSNDSSEAVTLAETSKVLDLLLSIVYRLDRAKSNLRNADFEVLNAVAEAAEKYSFDTVSDICEEYMCNSSAGHPSEVMVYAIRHDRLDVMDSAAPWLIGRPLDLLLDIFEQLKFLRAWVRYFSACNEKLGAIYANQPYYTTKSHSYNTCPAEDALPKAVLQAIAIMRTNPACFRDIEKIFRGPLLTAAKCSTCYDWFLEWKEQIANAMDSVPKFSTFL